MENNLLMYLSTASIKTLRFGFAALLGFIALSLLITPQSYAQQGQTVYISDVLFVPMRSGQGNEFRIINAAMRSGTALKKISESSDGDWTQVETQKGTKGWIRTQYISSNLPARNRLANALSELGKLKSKNIELEAQAKELKKNSIQLRQDLQGHNSNEIKLTTELDRIKDISANAVKVDSQYRSLLAEHELLRTERDSLAAENERLISANELSFMFYGALLIILGMVLAIILPYTRRRKRYNDWTN